MSIARTRSRILAATACIALAGCGGGSSGSSGGAAVTAPVVVVPVAPTPTATSGSSGPGITDSPTPTPTQTSTPASGDIVIVTPTPVQAPTPTPTVAPAPVAPPTPAPAPLPSATATPTPDATPTSVPAPTSTVAPAPVASPTTPTPTPPPLPSETVTPTPTSTPTTAPATVPSPTPQEEQTSPTDGVAYLAQLASNIADSIADAFRRFLALFTGNGSSTSWSSGLTAFDQPVLSADGASAVPVDVIRLARQATFGPTPDTINRIAALGMEGWLNEQFRLRGATYNDLIVWVPINYCQLNRNVPNCWARNFSRYPTAARFYANATLAPDQLRQRVAFALSQILVVSTAGVENGGGLASFQQMLLDNAFGNYRDILQKTTLHGYMGAYLSMANSARGAPSENYARELMQLLSMGPVQLNDDGTPMIGAKGTTIANYTADDVKGVARALTGWTYVKSGGLTDWTANNHTVAMVPKPAVYDTNAKQFLGVTVPAGASQEDSVRITLDAVFNHPSTPPRLARLMIQNLVTSNPSPGYVRRVAQVFRDNGAGARGDLKAVVRAILLDSEARGEEPRGDAGKVKEPVLAMVALARAIGLKTDGVAFVNRDVSPGQPLFQSPSVFNYYPPDYPLDGRLVSPASKLLSGGNVLALRTFLYDWTIRGEPGRTDWTYNIGVDNFSGTAPLWAGWEAIGNDPDRLVAVVNLLMLGNSATPTQLSAMRAVAQSITNPDAAIQARKRAQTLLYIAASTPNFLVDR